MKVTFVELPENLQADSPKWEDKKQLIQLEKSDVLLTNEMPFGRWLFDKAEYDAVTASDVIRENELGVEALKKLELPVVLSSRPIQHDSKLANEAFALINGVYHRAHRKQYFPDEPGFYEAAWFKGDQSGFEVINIGQVSVGFMLCTEVMFSEWARAYRRQGAHLIVVPRSTEQNIEKWKTAASLAAIVSGCYVVSSNRAGRFSDDITFGGHGFAFAPDGTLIAETSATKPIVSFELDIDLVQYQQRQFPCYVKEPNL
ncbi:carbon-nitrogen hydrolase family protein [Vibrio sp.]|nr:carbon-nitrogen hydrolase family protein [Vibrio sp.]